MRESRKRKGKFLRRTRERAKCRDKNHNGFSITDLSTCSIHFLVLFIPFMLLYLRNFHHKHNPRSPSPSHANKQFSSFSLRSFTTNFMSIEIIFSATPFSMRTYNFNSYFGTVFPLGEKKFYFYCIKNGAEGRLRVDRKILNLFIPSIPLFKCPLSSGGFLFHFIFS